MKLIKTLVMTLLVISFIGVSVVGATEVKDNKTPEQMDKKDVMIVTGQISQVRRYDGNLSFKVDINDEKSNHKQIVFHVSDKTRLIDAEGNPLSTESLKKGLEVKVTHGLAMTMSIPPQTSALSVEVIETSRLESLLNYLRTIFS